MKRIFKKGELIQSSGVILLFVGIVLEIIFKAHIFLIVITAGSTLFSIGTKLKYGNK